jgi:hypothetical protein
MNGETMSLFDYPRINFKGTIQLNPGTANNDDYAQQPGAALIPASFGPPYAGQVFGLIDSKTVQPRTFGMSDADFIAWVQKIQTFVISGSNPPQTMDVIPAEWNYYGDMESSIAAPDTQAAVVGVQTGPGSILTQANRAFRQARSSARRCNIRATSPTSIRRDRRPRRNSSSTA